jgi:hypothetical protein
MGQNNSAPAPREQRLQKEQRPPNKLSKPRTNTSANNLLNVTSPLGSKRNSEVDLRNLQRSSSVPSRPRSYVPSDNGLPGIQEGGGVGTSERGGSVTTTQETKDESNKNKRLSGLFRSKSSQVTPTTSSIVLGDTSECDSPVVGEFAVPEVNPLHRYSQHLNKRYPNEVVRERMGQSNDR